MDEAVIRICTQEVDPVLHHRCNVFMNQSQRTDGYDHQQYALEKLEQRDQEEALSRCLLLIPSRTWAC